MAGSDQLGLRFHGAVDTVTGSRFVLRAGNQCFLVDCGLFQGFKHLRLRNWAEPGFAPGALSGVLLTHAHLDHSGFLPVLCRDGYTGPIYATAATRDLCRFLLPDSGFIQEKDAARANRYGYTRHHPARPLYTQADANRCLQQFHNCAFRQPVALGEGITASFSRAGHILGAASILVECTSSRILFSGDLGQSDSATMAPPQPPPEADYVVIESTYGNRQRSREDPEERLGEIIRDTVNRGGTVIVPAFAVGRTQLLLHHLRRLQDARRIPKVPVFLDSPLAINATEVFANHAEDHHLSPGEAEAACALPRYVHDVDASRRLDRDPMPKIIIAGSGMATGGRVLHHLKVYLGDPRHTIVFSGYQAGGTRGEKLVNGAEQIRIHGEDWPVRASVENLDMLSAHADSDELLEWLGLLPRAPRAVFVVHGESSAAAALAERIREELRWPAILPDCEREYKLA